MPHNYITSEDLPTPSTPTSQSWEELGVPTALIAAGPKTVKAASGKTGSKGTSKKMGGMKAGTSKAKVQTEHNYNLSELAAMTDRQLKGYVGQNKSRQQPGWETRVELAELVLGQRGDVL